MKKFVLVSEEAISKGIRRIVALTGPEALKAEKKCTLLQTKVENIQSLVQEKMKNGSLNIKETSQEIARLTEVRMRTFRGFCKEGAVALFILEHDNLLSSKCGIFASCNFFFLCNRLSFLVFLG